MRGLLVQIKWVDRCVGKINIEKWPWVVLTLCTILLTVAEETEDCSESCDGRNSSDPGDSGDGGDICDISASSEIYNNTGKSSSCDNYN